jgi:hypothetical protein
MISPAAASGVGVLFVNEIRRSKLINYFAAVMLVFMAAIVPASEIVPLPAWLPPWVVIVVVALPLLELIWRSGLRPRLMWNDGGLTVVRWSTMSAYRWQRIARIHEEFNRMHIVLDDGTEDVWEFDQAWLWGKISRSYEARKGRRAALLTEALERGRQVGDVVRPPERAPRRPVSLYLLAVPAAVFGQLLVLAS